MVEVAGFSRALGLMRSSFLRLGVRTLVVFVLVTVFYASCTARVLPKQWGVEQRKFGFKRGIVDQIGRAHV